MAPNLELADKLQEKLERVAALEEKCAPKGVSFSVRGQEIHTTLSTTCALRDPLGAADAVIKMLEDVENLDSEIESLKFSAKYFTAAA